MAIRGHAAGSTQMPVRTAAPPSTGRRPLVVTSDGALLDDLLRLAASRGVDLEVAPDVIAARDRWAIAPFVLIGADATGACVRARLPLRPSVIVVARGAVAERPWSDAEVLRAEHVAVLPAAEPWLVARLVDHVAAPPGAGRVVAVLGGRGGAGASVLATALAVTAMRSGRAALLVDADPLGGGLDLVLGWESVEGLRWPELFGASGRVDPPALVGALPRRGSLCVLSFGRGDSGAVPADAMAATLDAGRRGRDVVVVDLPRRLDDAAALYALNAADRVLLVVPAELRACAAAARVVAALRPHRPSLSVVVRGPTPGRLTPSDIADTLDLPLAGALRPEPGLGRALEHGRAPAADGDGPLAGLCRRILADLEGRRRGTL
jgi:secretion/DNA translocation related CpaE-like protein